MIPYAGEFAALSTASCWAVASLFFTQAARRLGAFTLNHARITLALFILTLILVLTRGLEWAPEAGLRNYMLLAVSGWIGLTLGDLGYFSGFVDIGPRMTTLLMTLAPPFTALIAAPVLGERLGIRGVAGMALTLAGVIWVVRERGLSHVPRGHRIRGVLLASLASLAQAVGLVLSKLGMGTVVDPLPATAIRMAAATLGVWAIAGAAGKVGDLGRLRHDGRAGVAVLGATLLGPVTGITLSLFAVQHTKTGIAATLMATTPILVLPLVAVIEKERVSPRAVVGALVAVAGVAVLFLR